MITKLPTTASAKTTRNFTLTCTPKFLQTTLLSALFFLLLGVGQSWGQCNFRIQLRDSYGDGWNGGNISSLKVDANTVLSNLSLTSASSTNWTSMGSFTAYSGQSIRITYASGSYCSENLYRIQRNDSGNWNDVYTSGTCPTGTYTISSNGCTIALPACSGTPAPGNTISSSATVAPGGTVNLSLSSATTGTGVTYQWESSTTSSSSGYSNISGATSSTYTATVTANTWYRCKVTCSGSTGTSTATQVTLNYCTPVGSNNYYLTSVVTSGGITNISNSTTTGGYNNYSSSISCSNVNGVNTSITLTPSSGTNYFYCWIDWNNDLDFLDSNETIFATTSYTSNYVGTISIPSNTLAGNYRMRVANSWSGALVSCGPSSNGEFEDYTFTVAAAPSCSSLPTSLSASSITSSSATISWTAPASAPGSGYEIYYSTSSTSPVSATAATTTTAAGIVTKSITGLTANTTYYYWVRSNCNGTDKGTWVSGGTFYTGYCPSSTTYTGYYISKVVSTNGLTNISNNTGAMSSGGYGNFTAQSISNYPGATTNISTSIYYGYGAIYIWVDWNNDLDFNDSGEQVLNSGSIYSYTYPHVYASSFMVPLTASLGNYRMRIRYDYSSGNASCGAITYGETEDYTFTVVATPTCFMPTSLTASSITDTGASIGWTAPTTAPSNGYEYAVTTSSTPPSSGIASTSTSVSISALTSATSYYLHVRSYCGGSDYSAWQTSTFQTLVPGDNCSNAINLATLTSPYIGTTSDATNDVSICRTGYADKVFYINVPNGATITFQETSNDYDEYEYIGYGSDCTNPTQIQCWDNDVLAATTWQNTTGTSQIVWYVQDAYSGSGNFTLSWTLTLATPACVSTPAPATASSVCVSTSSTTLSWAAATYATGYDVYFSSGSTATTLVASNQASTSYDVGVLAAGTYAWKVVPLNGSLSPTGCSTWTFTVNPLSVAGTVSANQTICINNVPATITLTGNTGTIQWQQSATGTGSWSTVSTGTGGTTASYTPAALTSTTYYRARVTNGSCTVATSSTVTVTVTPLPTATWESTATAVCYSSSAQTTSLAYSATTASPTSYSITWSATTPANSFAAVSDQAFDGTATGGTISIAIPAGTNAGTYTGTITVKNANSCTSSAVQTFTVTVNAPNQADVTSTNTCGTATLVASGGASVAWYSDTFGITPVSTLGSTSTLTISNPTTADNYYAFTYDANGCRSQNYTAAPVELKYTNTYTGTGTDWFTAANWSCGIPTANSNVVIPTGKIVSIAYTPGEGPANANTVSLQGDARLTVTTDHGIVVKDKIDVASGATFTLENGASLVQVNPVVANVGSIKVKKATGNLGVNDCVFWSSPVQNIAMNTFAPNSSNFYWTFNSAVVNNADATSASYSWVSVPANATFEAGKGYYIKTPNTQQTNTPWTTEFNGTPNNGNIELVYPVEGDITERYYFVGNPYPSAISIDAFMEANAAYINKTIYFFREPNGNPETGYSTVNKNPTNQINFQSNGYGINPSGVIPSGQGFLVRLLPTATTYKVVFNNTMRVTNNHRSFNRSAQNNEDAYNLKLTAANARFSQAKVGYYENAHNEEEASFDVRSMDDGAFDLGSLLNQKNFKVQARAAYNQSDVVYLRFKTNVSGEHRITLSDTNGVFAADQMVIIKDNLTGVQHNLTANGDYVFTSATGTFTNRFEVIYQQAYYTALQANSCGATIANMSSLVYADIVNGATGYRFKVVNNTTSAVQTIDRPQHWFAFNMLSAYDYNTPYTISVQVQKDGVWTGYYGATCTVNSPNIATTGVMQINPSQCGMTLPTLGTVIATTPVAGATGYKFRITNTTAGAIGNNLVQEITRTNHWFSLGMLSRYNYGSSYAIEVAVKTTGGYTPYGNACTVYSPAVPTLATCGQTVATATTLVRTTAMTLATQYRFQVTRMSTQETITFDTANYWFSFRVNVPGYAAGEQYGVRVAVMTAGAWSPYGDACDITAPIATARTTEEAAPSEANLFKPVAYPNPFKSEFSIALATPFKEDVILVVYDLQGRLIEKQTVPVTLIDTIHIGANYQMGDYMLVVSQGPAIESMLLHKE
jgi:hypothetical protein